MNSFVVGFGLMAICTSIMLVAFAIVGIDREAIRLVAPFIIAMCAFAGASWTKS